MGCFYQEWNWGRIDHGSFLLLDRPRFSLKKTACCYALFGLAVVVSFSIWYVIDQQNYIRFAGILAIPVIGIFCLFMSGETIYLSLYKMALGFYMLAVTVFCGIDASRMWFGASMWADIALRIVMCFVILVLLPGRSGKVSWKGQISWRRRWICLVWLLCLSPS